jgi:polyisoprenoid-binding protein YceI
MRKCVPALVLLVSTVIAIEGFAEAVSAIHLAQAQPQSPGTTAPAPPAVADAGTTTYNVVPKMSVLKFVGSKGAAGIAVSSHPGGWTKFSGTVTVKDNDFTTMQVKLTIDMKSTFSDDKSLTEKLLHTPGFFEVDTHPTASFESTAVKKTDKGLEVTGNLNLHGVTKVVTFPCTVAMKGSDLTAKAEFSINRQDWKINFTQGAEGTLNSVILDDVPITFFITAKKSA